MHAHPHASPHTHGRRHLEPRRLREREPTSTPLANPAYRRLLLAQVISLAGTGITTVALALLAYEMAGANAGAVLGAALTLKMVAYVTLSPIAAALADRVDRRRLLVSLDLARFGTLLLMPFVTAVWQVLALVFVVSACAAGYTPAFQAAIPLVLPEDEQYTRALSFSRVAYDLADLLSPACAAALLLVMAVDELFLIDAASFVVSALLVWSARLPPGLGAAGGSARSWRRTTAGVRRFAQVPSLRGVLALNVAAAAASAMVIVNTVVLVRNGLDANGSAVAVALAICGGASALTALATPRLLRRHPDRRMMLVGATVLGCGLLAASSASSYPALLGVWVCLGIGLSLVQTPIGRVIRDAGTADELPGLFAAQFSLSHLAWLVTYPIARAPIAAPSTPAIAGVLGAAIGARAISLVLAAITAVAGVTAALVWRGEESSSQPTNQPVGDPPSP